MGNRGAFDLMGLTEWAILTILWRDGPCAVPHIQEQLGGARYNTVVSPLQSLQKKGFVTKSGPHMDHRFHARSKQALLMLVCERVLAELGASAAIIARRLRGRDAEVVAACESKSPSGRG